MAIKDIVDQPINVKGLNTEIPRSRTAFIPLDERIAVTDRDFESHSYHLMEFAEEYVNRTGEPHMDPWLASLLTDSALVLGDRFTHDINPQIGNFLEQDSESLLSRVKDWGEMTQMDTYLANLARNIIAGIMCFPHIKYFSDLKSEVLDKISENMEDIRYDSTSEWAPAKLEDYLLDLIYSEALLGKVDEAKVHLEKHWDKIKPIFDISFDHSGFFSFYSLAHLKVISEERFNEINPGMKLLIRKGNEYMDIQRNSKYKNIELLWARTVGAMGILTGDIILGENGLSRKKRAVPRVWSNPLPEERSF